MANRATEETLSEMRARYELAMNAYSDTREDELDDLRFYAASPDNQWQWPADILATRGAVQGQTINARPCLTINKLPQHVKQVTNDQRQNRPSGKVIPANDLADIEVAEIYDGIVRHIEYISDADVAYDTACENQVAQGEGYFRILTEYCSDDSFDQDIRIGRIRNSFSVFMDPMIEDPCGADADWCFITQDLSKQEYEREFPNAQPVSTLEDRGIGDTRMSNWINKDTIRIAEYFYVVHERKTLNLYPGGSTAYSGSPESKQAEAMGMKPIKTRDVDVRHVKWCKTNGYEFIEEQDWAGSYIPVIRVVGNEFYIDGRLYMSGLVRNAKDAQRMYNYWVSQEAEMLALAPKAPFIGYGGQFEGYEHQWKTANTTNWPYLEVNPDVTDANGAMLPLPQRAPPPLPQAGLIQAKMGAADDIKATTAQYDASLGLDGNEKSGRAIIARQRQSNNGSFHYVDNLARAIRYGTRQIIDLIPKIYDTQRVARIVGLEGNTEYAEINPMQPEPVRHIQNELGKTVKKIYNLGIGKYDVSVTTGPSYSTKRQESLEAMAQLLQANPSMWAIAGDLFIRHMDWPGAEEIAERFAKTIDPKLLAGGEDSDPALDSAQQQIEQMGMQMQQMQQMLANAQKSLDQQEVNIKAYEAETKRMQATMAGMTPEQIQDIVLGTVHGMITSGDLVSEMQPRTMGAMPPEVASAPAAEPNMGTLQ